MNRTPDNVASAIEQLQSLNRRLIEGVAAPLGLEPTLDAPGFLRAMVADFAQDPDYWRGIYARYYQLQLDLWKAYALRAETLKTVPEPDPSDRRFRGAEWRDIPYFDYLVRAYLLSANLIKDIVGHVPLEAHDKRKLSFLARQLVDAMSPANFAWSNPEALKLAHDTDGDSLRKGLQNLASDIEKGMVSMTDDAAFDIGRNLAITPGAVIFENEYMQLLQYRPTTDTVFEHPLVMVPPCINKYYILDLQPENSFVRYAIGEGHTVFMISWRNMPREMGRATWDDYLEQGVIKALKVAAEICGTPQVNALGFCVGGTLLGSALAVERARGHDPVASATLLAAMLDFSDTGELSVFVDERYVRRREQDFADGGVLPGRELALTFASLRANDLIWQYVVNNYLKGRTPEPFDLLYWNSDSTNLPGAMYVYYVRNMYLENNLRVPGRLAMCGVPVDLGRVDMPAYVVATREDHIVPWKTAFSSARLLAGKIELVLAASGHIAGVINPAQKNRRHYWVNTAREDDPERWLADATTHAGSWWPHWSAWLASFGGRRIASRSTLGGGNHNEIEPAPGRYVREKCR